MKKKRTISLKAHLWLYFCSFAVAIMLILWVLQIFFLSTFFSTMKLNEMKKIGALIEEQYDIDNENFYDFWFEHSFQSGMFAQLVTEDGEQLRNFNAFPDIEHHREEWTPRNGREPRFESRGFIDFRNFENFIARVKENGNNVSFVEHDEAQRASFAVYGSLLGKVDEKNIYLFLISPLERTDATRKVLETQLIIVSCISVLLALVLAYFIARRLSKPIEKTTEGARRLAVGDYDVRFESGSYREIDELSDVLNHATIELSKTDELRRDLISNVSHDLRTPLTIIKSYAEMIRDISGDNREKRLKHIGVIVDEANNLSLLVDDMLDLSRIQSGTLVMKQQKFDLKKLIIATVGRFEYYRENYGINFVLNLDSPYAIADGDEKRIEQVIYNLLANAVNYSGDDKTVIINLFDLEDRLKVSVCDNGCGISEQEIGRVWDKYYKASENHRRTTVGTGIGLSIVKKILLAHNANFGVNSTKGQGSEFWFELKK